MQADTTPLATFRQVGLLSRSGMPVAMAQRLTFEAARSAIEDLVHGHDGWPTEQWFAKHVGRPWRFNMRRLITLHIGRGLEAYPMVPQWTAITRLLFGLLGAMGIDLPAGRTDFQRWGLHPEDARGRVVQLLQAAATQGRWQINLATNAASTINALCEALTEGELRVVSHAADGTVRQWDVDQMMAFWQAREQGSEMTPAAMLIKLGVWP